MDAGLKSDASTNDPPDCCVPEELLVIKYFSGVPLGTPVVARVNTTFPPIYGCCVFTVRLSYVADVGVIWLEIALVVAERLLSVLMAR